MLLYYILVNIIINIISFEHLLNRSLKINKIVIPSCSFRFLSASALFRSNNWTWNRYYIFISTHGKEKLFSISLSINLSIYITFFFFLLRLLPSLAFQFLHFFLHPPFLSFYSIKATHDGSRRIRNRTLTRRRRFGIRGRRIFVGTIITTRVGWWYGRGWGWLVYIDINKE